MQLLTRARTMLDRAKSLRSQGFQIRIEHLGCLFCGLPTAGAAHWISASDIHGLVGAVRVEEWKPLRPLQQPQNRRLTVQPSLQPLTTALLCSFIAPLSVIASHREGPHEQTHRSSHCWPLGHSAD